MCEGRARNTFSRINYTRKRDPEAFAHHESLKGLITAGSLSAGKQAKIEHARDFLSKINFKNERNEWVGKRLKEKLLQENHSSG